MGSDHLKETTAMTIEARSDREMQLASQVAELKRELAELREALARTSQGAPRHTHNGRCGPSSGGRARLSETCR